MYALQTFLLPVQVPNIVSHEVCSPKGSQDVAFSADAGRRDFAHCCLHCTALIGSSASFCVLQAFQADTHGEQRRIAIACSATVLSFTEQIQQR